MRPSKSSSTRSLSILRMSRTSDGRGRWAGAWPEGIKVCTILTTERRVILSSNVVH